MQKVHFRLTSVPQKRCCLSSLIANTCLRWSWRLKECFALTSAVKGLRERRVSSLQKSGGFAMHMSCCVLQCLTPAIVPHFFLCLVGNKLRDREVDELFSDVGEYHGFIHTAGICLLSNRGGLGTSKLSSPGRSGGGAGKRRRACNYVSGIWIPPPTPLWLPVDWAVRFPPISAKWRRARTKIEKQVKARAKGNGVITNFILANQHCVLLQTDSKPDSRQANRSSSHSL